MDDSTAAAIMMWKEHTYAPTDIPFTEAVDSLILDDPLIYARQSDTRKSDWVICRTGTTTAATFVFAGVFSDGDPYDTGNLVPVKTPLPKGLDQSRVANHAGFKAAYSYAIDTYHDKDIWELQGLLEAYMMNVPGFNSRGLKRREWQNGSTWHPRYWFRVPMFLTCETRGGQPDPPTGLHEWVVAAHKRSTNYRANPVRPLICGLEGGRLQSIGKCTPQRLEYGDVVSVVFSLIYVEDREDWGPVPMVTHIIRVQHANRDTYPLTATVIAPDVVVGNTGLRIGFVVDAEKAAEADAMKEKAAAEAAKAKAAAVHARAKLLADATVQAKAAADAARAGSVVDAANSAAPPDMAENAQLRTGADSSLLVAADGAGPMSLDDKVDAIGTQSGHATSETDVAKASTPAQGAVTPGAVVQGKQVKDGHLSGSEMDVDDEEGRPVMSAGSSNSALTGEDDDDDGNSSEWTLTEDATAVTSDGEVPRGKRTRRGRGGSDDENVVPAKMGRGSKAGRGRRGGKTNK